MSLIEKVLIYQENRTRQVYAHRNAVNNALWINSWMKVFRKLMLIAYCQNVKTAPL